jgi:hypothetical protein
MPVLEKAMTETAMEGILLVRNIVVEREGARERRTRTKCFISI